jgi:transcriptional regulator GlxA family with amidase domain
MKVAIVVFDGVDEVDAIGPYEVFANAAQGGADVSVSLVTLDGREEVTGSHGVRIRPHGKWEGSADLVVVPGGGWNDRAPEGAWAQAQQGDLGAALKAHRQAGGHLASVCTGGMVLATAGLLDGLEATTHHGAIDQLADHGAIAVDARVVDAGEVVTCGGVTSGIDMALWIVEREFGARLADGIAREMEHQRVGEVRRAAPAER